MISFVESECIPLEENGWSKFFAGLSGLGGIATGGNVIGSIQKFQQGRYERLLADIKTNEQDPRQSKYNSIHSGPWRTILGGLGGSLPIIGAVFNVSNQIQLDRLKNEIKLHLSTVEFNELEKIHNNVQKNKKISVNEAKKLKDIEFKIKDSVENKR